MNIDRSKVKVPSVRIMRGTGWKGAYNRPAPKGAHKCLDRSAMAKLMAKLK